MPIRYCAGGPGAPALALLATMVLVSPAWAEDRNPQDKVLHPASTTIGPAATQPALSAATQPGSATTQPAPVTLNKIVVSSNLDVARSQIAPSLGAATYTIGENQIQAVPAGESASFQQVLLRAPGVVEDSFGQEHVRGEHGNLTYRVNGVLLPEPLSGFGQELDTRLIKSLTLIDGSLPAQFGFHTAGIVDVTTKSGAALDSNEISLYGGSFDTIHPSFQFGGTAGKFDYFVTGSYNHNDLGIENPTASHQALHDYTDQEKFFGYFAYQLDDTSRLSLLVNTSNADFEIPNTPGVPTAFPLAGHPAFNSANLDENQNEQEYYGVLAYQKTLETVSFQLSGFSRYGQIRFLPDPVGDLMFQGVASKVFNSFVTNGVEFDSAWIINEQHTLRAGLIADYTAEKLDSTTAVFATDPMTGDPVSDVPMSIGDNSRNNAWEVGLYVQDEWRITPKFTLNYGLRYDRFDANFDDEGQLSPRVNVVWKATDTTTIHGGYARYFSPPTIQNVSAGTVAKFVDTTNASENLRADPPLVETAHYFDVGLSQQITKPWAVNVDGFYKLAHNLVDEGQFGQAVILSPFNYRTAKVYGAEFSTTYKQGGLSLFGNFAWVVTAAHDVVSQQFEFENDELAYIQTHDIKLDHESAYTASAGASYAWKNDFVYIDFLYGDGLRKGFANTGKTSPYYPVNIGYEHVFRIGHAKQAIKLRIDIVNLFDEKYQLRDGTGIGVGAAQFGERRGIFGGVTYAF